MENKCQVSGMERCPTCGSRDYFVVCGKKGVTRIRDVVCTHVPKGSFWVCTEHKKEFLKCENGEKPHYKEVKVRRTIKKSK